MGNKSKIAITEKRPWVHYLPLSFIPERRARVPAFVRSACIIYTHIYTRAMQWVYIYRRGVIRVRPREPRGPLTNVLKRVQSRKSLISFLNGPHRRRFMALLSPLSLFLVLARARTHVLYTRSCIERGRAWNGVSLVRRDYRFHGHAFSIAASSSLLGDIFTFYDGVAALSESGGLLLLLRWWERL